MQKETYSLIIELLRMIKVEKAIIKAEEKCSQAINNPNDTKVPKELLSEELENLRKKEIELKIMKSENLKKLISLDPTIIEFLGVLGIENSEYEGITIESEREEKSR